jgi:hypothetical protein
MKELNTKERVSRLSMDSGYGGTISFHAFNAG